MSINSLLTDKENGRSVSISSYRALEVSNVVGDVPEIGTENRLRYNSQPLTDSTGSANMAVDGSVTPVEFNYKSTEDYDIIINKLVVLLVDGSIAFNKFGAEPALTNGWTLHILEAGAFTSFINSSTTGQIIADSGFPTNYEIISNFNANNDDAFILSIDISESVPGGIRIGRGTQDKIFATVQDNLTGLVDFRVTAIGNRHYP